ncbi:YfcC family protein [Desmospora activa]|uniref:Putative ion transporter superfamily protein YfcC n=1 Tax=Desmospora activa DSM 45169 TaxID=1121389 RepID=A0A2T4ZBR0_9BACL|nr:AbgT family transporter [Desmospora activa]PTM59341.1 putative ion transporter superfamily protein YfcC [Desmospora activa DSM 45169]
MASGNKASSPSSQSRPDPEFTVNQLRIPHIYVILLGMIVLVALATFIIPAGEYDRIAGPEGREVIKPDSYQQVDSTPIGILQVMMVIPKGLLDAGEVVVFTLIIGGMFMVLRKTGIIQLGVNHLTHCFAQRSIWVIPVLMILFATIASFIGTPELSLVYVPVLLPLLLALGYDSMTAVAIALVATAAGFTGGLTNPVTIGLSQQIANLPLYSGAGFRLIVFIVMLSIGIGYVVQYAIKVKKDPSYSITYENDQVKREEIRTQQNQHKQQQGTPRQKAASVAAVIFFALLVYGVLIEGWFMMELSGLFLLMTIVVGVLAGLKSTKICEAFNEGLKSVLMAAFIIGMARGIAVMMQEGKIMDTVIYAFAQAVSFLPGTLTALGMLIVQSLFNFLVPSGSGQAVITMPIMAPLADLLGVTRQTAVLAFQFGDGISNIIYPTSGYFMATLALADVRWDRWVRFILPLLLMWVILAAIFITIAHAIQWGPF